MLNKQHIFIETTIKLFFLLWLFLFCTLSANAESVSSEYKIKAALLYKLTRFVDWPEVSNKGTEKHFAICILGRDDFGAALDALSTRKVKGLPIIVQRFEQSSDTKVSSCKLIFISDSKMAFLDTISQSLVQYPLLTVGDGKEFALNGGMIQLSYEKNKIGFKINLKQVKRSGLTISAPLLELSTIVDK